MIKDNIVNAKKYQESLKFRLGFEFLEDISPKIANGKYEILGKKVFATVQEYTSKTPDECKFEAHRKYIDIQYIIKGEEQIGVCGIENFSPLTEYDCEKDIIFLHKKEIAMPKFIHLQEKEFAIFMPKDAHMPSICLDAPCVVKKVVVKIEV